MMGSTPRRHLLRTAGGALATGLAGCSFGTESDSGTGSGSGSGPDSDPASGPGNGGDSTPPPGRTYTFEVHNRITAADFEKTDAVHGTPTTVITLEASRSVRGEDNPVLFGQDVELAPGESRTFESAFTTEKGESYLVTADLQPYHEVEGRLPRGYSARLRFTPGEFNTPESDVLTVTVADNRGGEPLRPLVSFD